MGRKKKSVSDSVATEDESNEQQQQQQKKRLRHALSADSITRRSHPTENNSLKQVEFGTSLKSAKKKNKKPNTKKGILSCLFCDWCCILQVSVVLLLFSAWIAKERLDPEEKLLGKIIENELITNIAGPITFVEKPGTLLAKEGLKVKHPVVFIPGIISTGLEVWQAKPCARKHFRQRFWGTSLMIQKVLLSKECWLEHVCLNLTTWRDPEGIKLRSASGLSAADYFVGEYWVWGKVIENLAEVGYDETNMYMASYDWRLPFKYLEERDHYFTRLKLNIEFLKQTNKNEKVVITSHSMGGLVVQYFLKWVESPLGGNGGPSWVNEHVEAYVNIAGAILGVPKAISSVLSGEMRDTAELNSMLQFIKENLMSKNDMLVMFRSFGSIPSMFPKGGNAVWGNSTFSPDNITLGNMITFVKDDVSEDDTEKFDKLKDQQPDIQELSTCTVDTGDKALEQSVIDAAVKKKIGQVNYTLDDTYPLLREVAPEYMERVDELYSFGVAHDFTNPKYQDQKYWTNPLESQLPYAPNMKLYCLYGVGKDTERAYYYQESQHQCSNIPISINTQVSSKDSKLSFGVQLGEGDGTVPLLSLGFMCVKGWKNPLYNPSGLQVITREFPHQVQNLVEATASGLNAAIRGGVTTADHVDIMGNHQLLEDMIRIATGDSKPNENKILSSIIEYSNKINL